MLNLYQKLQWQVKKNQFWDKIQRCSTNKQMANTIRIEFSKKTTLFRLNYSENEILRWLRNFNHLADDIECTKTRAVALFKISQFRLKSAENIDQNRLPEDQSALFNSTIWRR